MDIPLPPAQHFSSSHPHPRPSSNLLASLQTYEPPAFHDPLFDPNTMYPPSASSLPPFPINSPPRSQTQYNDQIQHLQDPMSLFFNPNPFLANEFQNPLNSEFVDMSFLDGIGIDNVTRGSYDNRGWEESGTYCGSGTMNLGGD
ncbi:hypothetical protein JAAARDRAFT_354241 [Jaapia argillacea MUCL 33604]|uniref:Uncharacterized protein n=1 Tax=Jaapia argillacea MUCL 33604 TaxID=933084 RepID=A0A067PJF1_9AGAM|nr:hypothetical protein JAAARDRAFT_354241 [Jaapia argillacea MUCL 33604]